MLKEAGERAKGSTLYITLEPCNHDGRTPPCTAEIIKAGISRVVIGCADPNPHVEGGGAEKLKAAGIEVVSGVLEKDAKQLIRAWTKYITEETSYLALKLASSLDGRIATRTGASKWITCADSRAPRANPEGTSRCGHGGDQHDHRRRSSTDGAGRARTQPGAESWSTANYASRPTAS